MKYPRISWENTVWSEERETLLCPTLPFLQQIFKDDVQGFPPPRIFMSIRDSCKLPPTPRKCTENNPAVSDSLSHWLNVENILAMAPSKRKIKKVLYDFCCRYLFRHQSKMSSSKKIDLKRDFAAGVNLSEAPPPLLGFCLGWCSSFVGSESGQIQSLKSWRIWSPSGQFLWRHFALVFI